MRGDQAPAARVIGHTLNWASLLSRHSAARYGQDMRNWRPSAAVVAPLDVLERQVVRTEVPTTDPVVAS